ncbi:Uncharacterized conserved protein YbbC, DUF1343 family [Lishizhenia tianjinensis]|uniref:Uncharacterized conserved protein YbbC, DUF1343 family n=1 Tax=Lishizhenia tianjinensis TaxID=477690 RepID=A0A1I7BMS2_9FLAO|nr:DUF1343 domain-containing protein [Lishizhenia tianjinensis]SFT88480.1 Uncharacterized conserved protein YbbC, DUF1343 family [Lishizhenia tianjinensis]
MYSIHKFFGLLFTISLGVGSLHAQNDSQATETIPVQVEFKRPLQMGAENTEAYLEQLKGKTVGVVANQTSTKDTLHLVDFLLNEKIKVARVFSPEHGFRGNADAGEHVKSDTDAKTGLPLVSLYGSNKKPSPEQLKGLDVVVFDLQDVGVRFYTYISTLHYVMEACAEEGIAVVVLDRPNPNIDVVDGPVRKEGFESFVGMHPIPILHGMTIGEYAKMINGEKWLGNGISCDLTVVPCLNYRRTDNYVLPIAPSPNLRTREAIYLYPSLCLFEGTAMSVGRGTDTPFEVYGHPNYGDSSTAFNFTPTPSYGAKHPKLEGELCRGKNLHQAGKKKMNYLYLSWLIDAYKNTEVDEFFTKGGNWFDLLAGTDELRKQIEKGLPETLIRGSWKADLDAFKEMRKAYLIYQ